MLNTLPASAEVRASSTCADKLPQMLLDYAKHKHLDALHYHTLVRSFGDFAAFPNKRSL